MARKKNYIRASDIGLYVYCRRAWWLRRVGGFEPDDPEGRLTAGTAAHARHGSRVRRSRRNQKIALFCLVLGAILLGAMLATLFI